GVVLAAPRQHLNDAPRLVVAADDGVERALARLLHEIDGVLRERAAVVALVLDDGAALARHLERALDAIPRRAVIAPQAAGPARGGGAGARRARLRPSGARRRRVRVRAGVWLGVCRGGLRGGRRRAWRRGGPPPRPRRRRWRPPRRVARVQPQHRRAAGRS